MKFASTYLCPNNADVIKVEVRLSQVGTQQVEGFDFALLNII